MTDGGWGAGGSGLPQYPGSPGSGGGQGPSGGGGLPPPPPSWYGGPEQYKGSQYGLPWSGPGSLASQWMRLLARILDAIFLLPWTAGMFIALSLALHGYIGRTYNTVNQSGTTTEHLHLALGSVGGLFLFSLIQLIGALIYEGVLTGAFGRTPGKAIVRIRIAPVANPTQWISGQLAALRYAYFAVPSLIPRVGVLWEIIDPMWCLFDRGRQCLHDKLVKTIVINQP
jgi:uncharacterized RDD family membrane protein YckC